jgi:hypothetical protein
MASGGLALGAQERMLDKVGAFRIDKPGMPTFSAKEEAEVDEETAIEIVDSATHVMEAPITIFPIGEAVQAIADEAKLRAAASRVPPEPIETRRITPPMVRRPKNKKAKV